MDKICRIGIIGCGGIARMHADMYKAYDRTEIVTLADAKSI